MRTLQLKPGDTFAENELDPPFWLVADVWNGATTILQRTRPEETMGDLRKAATALVDARRGNNHREFDRRTRKTV